MATKQQNYCVTYQGRLTNYYGRSKISLGIQGLPGSFCEQAAWALEEWLKTRFEIHFCRDVAGVLFSLDANVVELGLYAVCNSGSGYCRGTLAALFEHPLLQNLVGDITIPVQQCLLCHPASSLAALQRIVGHPQAIAQCEQTLVRDFPQLRLEPGTDHDDTAALAERVSRDPDWRDTATLASPRAAELHGLRIIREGVQHDPQNCTTFLVVSKKKIPGPLTPPYQGEM